MNLWQAVFVLACARFLSSCGGDPCEAGKSVFTGQLPAQCSATAPGTTPAVQPGQKVVSYALSGTATAATVYYRHAGGSLSQVDDVSLPWGFQYVASPGDSLYISAYNTGSSASITVAIVVDGVTVKSTTASGLAANARAESACC